MPTPVRCMFCLVVLFTLCVAGRVSADLDAGAYDRFYDRYVGTWKANVAKSRYLVGEPPKEGNTFTYGAVPGRKGIQYNGGAIHPLDGKEHPTSPDRPGASIVREVLDEFTIVTTTKRNGRVTGRNTFVLAPDGRSGAFVVTDFDEQGHATIRSLVYYEKQ
jgi:hypothetical protein